MGGGQTKDQDFKKVRLLKNHHQETVEKILAGRSKGTGRIEKSFYVLG